MNKTNKTKWTKGKNKSCWYDILALSPFNRRFFYCSLKPSYYFQVIYVFKVNPFTSKDNHIEYQKWILAVLNVDITRNDRNLYTALLEKLANSSQICWRPTDCGHCQISKEKGCLFQMFHTYPTAWTLDYLNTKSYSFSFSLRVTLSH